MRTALALMVAAAGVAAADPVKEDDVMAKRLVERIQEVDELKQEMRRLEKDTRQLYSQHAGLRREYEALEKRKAEDAGYELWTELVSLRAENKKLKVTLQECRDQEALLRRQLEYLRNLDPSKPVGKSTTDIPTKVQRLIDEPS